MSLNLPTETKIADLRSKGITSFSPWSQHYLFSAIFLICLSLLANSFWQALLDFYKNSALTLNAPHQILIAGLKVLLLPLLIASAGATIWGLFQNRFTVNINFIVLDFSRPFKFSQRLIGAGFKMASTILKLSISTFLLLLLAKATWSTIIGLSKLDQTQLLKYIGFFSRNALIYLGVFLLLYALLVYGLGYFSFLWLNRMSRTDLEAEN